MVCLHCLTLDSCANADTNSRTEKVTMDVNGMALRLVLNGYSPYLPQPRSWSKSSGNISEHIIKLNSLFHSIGIGL